MRGCRVCATVALQVGQSTWIGLLPIVQVQGKDKQWNSLISSVLESILSSQSALLVPQPSLCGLLFFVVYKPFQLAFSWISDVFQEELL